MKTRDYETKFNLTEVHVECEHYKTQCEGLTERRTVVDDLRSDNELLK